MAKATRTKLTKVNDVFPPRELREAKKPVREAWLNAEAKRLEGEGLVARIVGIGSYQHLSVFQPSQVEYRVQIRCEIVREAVAARVPVMAEQYVAFARRQFDYLVSVFGPTMKGAYSSRQGQSWRGFVARLCDGVNANFAGWPERYELNEKRLAAWGLEQAEAAAAQWIAKIERKIGGVADATVTSGSTDMVSFTIKGTLNGHAIALWQQPVLKCSSKGTLFHQFPARIYVDGKFTPEADFDAAVEA